MILGRNQRFVIAYVSVRKIQESAFQATLIELFHIILLLQIHVLKLSLGMQQCLA